MSKLTKQEALKKIEELQQYVEEIEEEEEFDPKKVKIKACRDSVVIYYDEDYRGNGTSLFKISERGVYRFSSVNKKVPINLEGLDRVMLDE